MAHPTESTTQNKADDAPSEEPAARIPSEVPAQSNRRRFTAD